MKEILQGLPQAEVQGKMRRLETNEAYTDFISNKLGETVLGQDEACDAVARRVAIFEAGFNDPSRPLGSIYELGPSGTGKTEMAHALSKYMFDDPDSDRLKIVNMGEFQEHHTAMRFVGAPPSYVGFREKPEISHDWLHKGRSVIVFDEAEKAHPSLHRMMLSILDKGKVNARNGEEGVQPLDFSHSFIFFTSNVAGQEIQDITDGKGQMGFQSREPTRQDKERDIERVATAGLKKTFAPEFIKRLDEIVTFKPLEGSEVFEGIFWKFVTQRNDHLLKTMEGNAPFFSATNEFKAHILESSKGDAREMRRILEREMFAKAASAFMGVDITGKPLVADYEDDQVVFYTDTDPEGDEELPSNVVLFDKGK
jgi:ATP-dependent Clp protease ATP-binding subunit ClpC